VVGIGSGTTIVHAVDRIGKAGICRFFINNPLNARLMNALSLSIAMPTMSGTLLIINIQQNQLIFRNL